MYFLNIVSYFLNNPEKKSSAPFSSWRKLRLREVKYNNFLTITQVIRVVRIQTQVYLTVKHVRDLSVASPLFKKKIVLRRAGLVVRCLRVGCGCQL